MNILLISRYHPELIRGGAQQVAYEVFEGLKAVGATVNLLAAIDGACPPGLFRPGAHITGFDGREGEYLFLSRDYDLDWHRTSDAALIDAYVEFLQRLRPDVVHFQHFLSLGIDLLTLTRGVLPQAKIIFTCHEFLAICAADGLMVRTTDGSLCTHASPVRCHQCRPERSPAAFLARRLWMQRHLEAVDFFTVPSRFMIEPYVAWGLPHDKFIHVPHGQQVTAAPATVWLGAEQGPRNRFGFFGQMVDAKGLHILLQAVDLLRGAGFTGFTLDINGANLDFASTEKREMIAAFLTAEAARPAAERIVISNGAYHPDHQPYRLARIDWVVTPSVCWESYGLVISEAWSAGKPVIASAAGGPAERIVHDHDGLLFPLGDARALAATLRRACTEPGLWERLAANITPPPTRETMVRNLQNLYAA